MQWRADRLDTSPLMQKLVSYFNTVQCPSVCERVLIIHIVSVVTVNIEIRYCERCGTTCCCVNESLPKHGNVRINSTGNLPALATY